jgi:hypothetical protein
MTSATLENQTAHCQSAREIAARSISNASSSQFHQEAMYISEGIALIPELSQLILDLSQSYNPFHPVSRMSGVIRTATFGPTFLVTVVPPFMHDFHHFLERG